MPNSCKMTTDLTAALLKTNTLTVFKCRYF